VCVLILSAVQDGINVRWSSCEVPVIRVIFWSNSNFPDRFWKKIHKHYILWKYLQWKPSYMRTEGRGRDEANSRFSKICKRALNWYVAGICRTYKFLRSLAWRGRCRDSSSKSSSWLVFRRVRKIVKSDKLLRHVCPNGTAGLPLDGCSWNLEV
jgi:hypothetical protein